MSQEEIKQLITKRAQIKSAVTRFRRFLESVNNEDVDVIDIQARINNFEKTLSVFDDVQSSIELLNEQEFNSNIREEFENSYYGLLSAAKRLVLSNTNSNNRETLNSSNNGSSLNNQVRLPKIELPVFDGNYDQWYSFHDTFDSLINANKDITDIQKLHYLKSSLRGNAKDLIQSLDITSENYAVAWELLKERYDNKKLIITKHIRSLFEIPSVTKECNVGLRKIIDTLEKHMRALKALGRPTEQWDDLIIHVVCSKIDNVTNKEWESSLKKDEIPKLSQLTSFIAHKCQTLESLFKKSPVTNVPSKTKTITHLVTNKNICSICNKEHAVQECDVFLQMNVEERLQEAKAKHLCLNCFKSNHITYKCLASKRCSKCHKKHNTLVHVEHQTQTTSSRNPPHQSSNPRGQDEKARQAQVFSTNNSCSTPQNNSIVLLSTALIFVTDKNGKKHECRALLDSGSMSHFITTSMAEELGLQLKKINFPIVGINQSTSMVNYSVDAQIHSKFNSFKANLNCLVLEKITENLPMQHIDIESFQIPTNIKLADPHFHATKHIDLLIGAGLFWDLLCVGKINLPGNRPTLHKTHLGWIVAGNTTFEGSTKGQLCNLSTTRKLDQLVSKFWELEDCLSKNQSTTEENACEEHFIKNTTRDSEGRFVVRLPFTNEHVLGHSRDIALKQFKTLEKRLSKNPILKTEYDRFMKEYEELGHMTPVQNENEYQGFYLPHHAVINETSSTTKLRVVFNGSCKTSNGTSLNDVLLVGPKIQQDLFSIVMRFRTHKYVMTADVTKMYRQILVHPEERKFQKILWRDDVSKDMRCYELNTVTYGTAPASFLAIRCLHKLAEEFKDLCPIGSKIVLTDFYVDDLLTGADTIDDLICIKNEVVAILSSGGFKLRKWCTNNKEVLSIIDCSPENAIINLDHEGAIKTLGLQWNSLEDTLQFSVPKLDHTQRITKRTILSDVAQVFDPLGLIGPVIVTAKVLIQKLWQLKLDWDESVPTDIHTKWFYYRKQFEYLRQYKIPRHLLPINYVSKIEIHGFCDASEAAYAACVYIRVSNDYHQHHVQLLSSKSRVAPLKATTIPRLELCSAVLLSQLVRKTIEAFKIAINGIYYWTDSSIVLSWIGSPSRQWDTFVANRVSSIQQLTDTSSWHHISTSLNPADVLSRGSSPEQLQNTSRWWSGPEFLSLDDELWPRTVIEVPSEMPERRRTLANTAVITEPLIKYERFSSYTKLIRSMAYVLRFINRCKGHEEKHKWLSSCELTTATYYVVKDIQRSEFATDISHLKQLGSVSSKSKTLSLNPFLDENGIIRVGGRLQMSHLPPDIKHPILLSTSHHFTRLVILHYHNKLLHSGTEATLAGIRSQYWPLAARSKIRFIIKNCVTCFKSKPTSSKHLMGNLPQTRLQPVKPFTNCGIDFFGPLYIKEKRRNAPATKVYGAIFVCFATRAVHIELVTGLSADAFIAALNRMISRRGKISNMYSDNGTNFVAANKELKRLRTFFLKELRQQRLSDFFSCAGISWHFIPPYSPHFGGLWEAAVKSTKTHLRKIAGNSVLTYEEMYTLLCKIECVLNSRPITPISSDPNDLSFLTPGHFLVGDSLTAIPIPNLTDIPTNNLSRWQLVQQLLQHFWVRWQKEYLHNLQQRTKWRSNQGMSLQPGQMVVIREDNLPPIHWKMGRVISIHPGSDGVVRVASIKTVGGVIKRATARLCVLPVPPADCPEEE